MIRSRLGSLNVDVFVTGATACHFGERVSVAVSESQVTAVPVAIKMVVGVWVPHPWCVFHEMTPRYARLGHSMRTSAALERLERLERNIS